MIIRGDDIGIADSSAFSHGLRGFKTPNIDRVAHEGMLFTDYYGEQSRTAGRASFITGQHGLRTGMTKVGLPLATPGLQNVHLGGFNLLPYLTGQVEKGPRDSFLYCNDDQRLTGLRYDNLRLLHRPANLKHHY